MSKRSAFSVFRGKDKLKKDELDTSESSPKMNARRGSLPGISSNVNQKRDSSLTPPSRERISKNIGISEPRFNSFRKSLRKRSKKETCHEVNLKQAGKENKVQKVLDRTDRTEKLRVDNLSLEEKFLPEVTKQRKEQEELHSVTTVNLTNGNGGSSSSSRLPNSKSTKIENRKRCSSSSDIHRLNGRQVIPTKRQIITAKGRIQPHSMTDVLVDNDGERITSGDKLFAWLIAPITTKQFFGDVWQKKPCFIKRRQPKYNHIWFSTKELDKILRTQNVQFTKNLDIAVYRDGKRETLNPEGRAFAPTVWKLYEDGCSVRLLNPQTFSKNVWSLSSKLQEYFGCFVGSNIYLTPPGSQGFAPHYDDIEAFVIQLEGKKHWKLYPARDANDVLPRYSSKNLTQEELAEPILDRVLEPGDTLYFPRGVIHQAVTLEDTHSLHLTLSFYQKYTWSDFMEKLVPMALQTALEDDVEFRKGLPIGCHSHVGISNSEKSTSERKAFIRTVEQLMKKLVSYVSVDIAADELVLDQMDEFLPPCLTSEESNCTVFGNGAFWDSGGVHKKSELDLDTELKITRPGIARILAEDDGPHIHYTVENSRQYKEVPLKRVDIPIEMAAAAEFLLFSHPEYVKVRDIPLENNQAKLSLSNQFYNMGLLRTKDPLP